VDERVPELDHLIHALPTHAQVLVLQRHEALLPQLHRWTQAHRREQAAPIVGLHLVGHGEPGQVYVGGTCLNTISIQASWPEWEALTPVLDDTAQCWVYGCHSGQGEAGHAFINTLADALCVHVHAASHPVGASALGGSWDFDRSTQPSPYLALHNPVASAWQRSGWGHVLIWLNETPVPQSYPGKALRVCPQGR
jgi:hypothetical protein